MNVPAVLNLFRIARDPSLCLPHYTVPTFAQLPVPLSHAFKNYRNGEKAVDIRAVVLDKDNCFAVPNQDVIHPPYNAKFQALIDTYGVDNVLIVSNSSGTLSKDPHGLNAEALERNTGVKVLRHSAKKPACGSEIMAHFGNRVTSSSQIAVIGDRLFTDAVMANMMGAWSVWIKEGVVQDRGLVTRVEYGVSSFLLNRGFKPPTP